MIDAVNDHDSSVSGTSTPIASSSASRSREAPADRPTISERRRRERVAVGGTAGAVPAREPSLPLDRRSVGERIRVDVTVGPALQPVVTDGAAASRPRDVGVAPIDSTKAVSSASTAPRLPRSSRPGARAARCALVGTLTVAADAGFVTEQVLHVMPVLVGDHVRLRERTAGGTELRPHVVEERQVEIHPAVGGTVEGPDRAGRRRRNQWTGCRYRARSAPLSRRHPRERRRPVGLHAVDHGDDSAIVR